jgi:hypothetical protein
LLAQVDVSMVMRVVLLRAADEHVVRAGIMARPCART